MQLVGVVIAQCVESSGIMRGNKHMVCGRAELGYRDTTRRYYGRKEGSRRPKGKVCISDDRR